MWIAEVEDIPQRIKSMISSPLLLAYQFTEKPYALRFEIIRHPHTPLLEAVIEKGNLATVVTPEGREITHLLLPIHNKNEQFLALGLPAESFIWHASVDGRVVKPAKNAGGKYLLPLEKERTKGEGFEVEMVYVREGGILNGAELALTGPTFSLPSSGIDWEVYLPEDRWFHRFSGNLIKVTEKGEKMQFSFLKYQDLEREWRGKQRKLGKSYSKAGEELSKKKEYEGAIKNFQRAMRYDAKQAEVQQLFNDAIVNISLISFTGQDILMLNAE